jgi:hypothetical protein
MCCDVTSIAFQSDLDELLEADNEYRDSPCLARLWYLVADLIDRWEKLEKRPERPLVPPERRRRPHVDAFADITPIDESTLLERSQLLDAIEDDYDIEWKTDEIIAMITFASSSELQEQLRSLCREYIDIFSTSARSLPAQIETDGYRWFPLYGN